MEINPRFLDIDYAVRGPISSRAGELEGLLKKKSAGEGLPFKEVIRTNTGNPHALGQKPFTFFRQVMSGVLYPEICEHFPKDVKTRVDAILADAKNSVGAYTHSQGLPVVRESVSRWLKERDGFAADVNNIFCTNGASEGARALMSSLIWDKSHGVLTPIPQYPLYTAGTGLCGGTTVPYYLNESENWAIDPESVRASVRKAKSEGVTVKMMVVINPGNPSGQVLTHDCIYELLKIAKEEKFVIIADEVYQVNVYQETTFLPFRKALHELMEKDESFKSVQVVNLHSTSKGLIGECGIRGGYFELMNCPTEFRDALYKFASLSLCPNTMGQIALEVMVNPPKDGDASYALYKEEETRLFASLKKRAVIMSEGLNAIEGITSNVVQGALYAFVKIDLPEHIHIAAQNAGVEPDAFYCMSLLEATGICTIPGSGFKQQKGTYHFRTTILPPTEKIEKLVKDVKNFHETFVSVTEP